MNRLWLAVLAAGLAWGGAAEARLPAIDVDLTCTGRESAHGSLSFDQHTDRPVTFSVHLDHAGCPFVNGTLALSFCGSEPSRTETRTATSLDIQVSRGTTPMSRYSWGFSLDYLTGKVELGDGAIDLGRTVEGHCSLSHPGRVD